VPNDAAPSTTDLHFLTIAEAANLIERRQLSPIALTRAFLDRIAAIDPQLNAYLLVTAEQALDQARIAEAEIMAGNYRGPMHGIPFALKDIYCTAGIRTTSHSRTRANYIPDFDATIVAKLHQAGAILLGKLATHEFAHGGPSFDLPWPPARNPWNREHFTGGSSSGSGAGAAAGLMMGALGSDTGGSIRSGAVWPGRVETDVWPGQSVWRLYQLVQLRPRWPDDLVGRGLRHHAAGNRRPQSEGSGERGPDGARLPRRADRRHQGSAHRRAAPPVRAGRTDTAGGEGGTGSGV
jgi:hypothetical protein